MSQSHFEFMSYLVTSPWQHHRKCTCVCLTESLLDQLQEEQRWLISYGPTCIDMCLSSPLFSPEQNNSHSLYSWESSHVFIGFHKNETHRVLTHISKRAAFSNSRTRQRERASKVHRETKRERMSNLTHPGIKWWWLCIMTLCMQTEPSVGFAVDCFPAETSLCICIQYIMDWARHIIQSEIANKTLERVATQLP